MSTMSTNIYALKKAQFVSHLNAAALSSPPWKSVAKRGTGLESEAEESYLLSSMKAELRQYPQHRKHTQSPKNKGRKNSSRTSIYCLSVPTG